MPSVPSGPFSPHRPPGYPPARRLELVETLFGHQVADPYRWLEDADDPECRTWMATEDELCRSWLKSLPGRAGLRERLAELLPGYVSPPVVIGRRRFFLRRRPGEEHAGLWVEEGGAERVLVDPSALSEDHTVTLDGWAPSREGDRLAYLLSAGGDEESAIRVIDVGTGEVIDGPIDRSRYSPIAWLPGGGALYYVRRLARDQVPSGEERYHRRVYLHRVGTDPADDVMVFGEGSDKTSYFGVSTSDDGRWLAVTVSLGTAPRNDCYVANLGPGDEDRPRWSVVLEGADAQAWPLLGRGDRLYAVTDVDAPRRRLVAVDPARPGRPGWREVLPEDPGGGVLDDVVLAGDALVAVRSRHAVSEVAVHDRESGALRAVVAFPGLGSAGVTGRPDEAPEAWIGYTDHTTPYGVLHLDVATGVTSTWAVPPGWDGPWPAGPAAGRGGGSPVEPAPGVEPVDGVVHRGGSGAAPEVVRARQVTYRSADGTEVRMFVIARGGEPKEPRPTILYGYGGFAVSLMPAYSSSILAWVEAGGVYATCAGEARRAKPGTGRG